MKTMKTFSNRMETTGGDRPHLRQADLFRAMYSGKCAAGTALWYNCAIMNEFLDRVANILEMPSAAPDLDFRSVRGWGSMMGFALFIMLEDEYGVKMDPGRFPELKTVADLMRVAGIETT